MTMYTIMAEKKIGKFKKFLLALMGISICNSYTPRKGRGGYIENGFQKIKRL